ncbi:MAG: hypothetical protein BJ554DRAFT_3366 [Olpidium bornovanus]|uniref:Uncharacterized protein n=1 Tax=Olpidium bornovanus TaxID=278681 RepID=A0A8H8DFK8_9FUNG|nr:MAG: hypothetical protein BJ554DRAFT_3366 [Olpidium bornovanus]
MSIENLLNPIEEDEAAHPELDDLGILAYVQDAEEQEEEAPEGEEILDDLGILAFVQDAEKEEAPEGEEIVTLKRQTSFRESVFLLICLMFLNPSTAMPLK